MSDAKLFTYSRMTIDEYLSVLRDMYVKAWNVQPDEGWHPTDLYHNMTTTMDCLEVTLEWQRKKARP